MTNQQALKDELESRELQIQNLIAEITANQEEIRQLTFAVSLHKETIEIARKQEVRIR